MACSGYAGRGQTNHLSTSPPGLAINRSLNIERTADLSPINIGAKTTRRNTNTVGPVKLRAAALVRPTINAIGVSDSQLCTTVRCEAKFDLAEHVGCA